MTLAVDLPIVGRAAPDASREEVIAHIARGARLIRMKDLANVVNAGQGHIGGEFSIIDVLATLYLHVANINPDNLTDRDRDRIILSKGHTPPMPCTPLLPRRGSSIPPSWTPSSNPVPASTGIRPVPGSPGSRPVRGPWGTACPSGSVMPSPPRSMTPRGGSSC